MSNVIELLDALSKLTDGEFAVLSNVLAKVKTLASNAELQANQAMQWTQNALQKVYTPSFTYIDPATGLSETFTLPSYQSVDGYPIVFGNADTLNGETIATRSTTFAFGAKAFLGYANDATGAPYVDTSYTGGSIANLGEIEVVNYRTMIKAIQNATSTGSTETISMISEIQDQLTGLIATVSTLSVSYSTTASEYATTATLVTSLNSAVNDPTTGLLHTVATLNTNYSTVATDLSSTATLASTLDSEIHNSTTGILASLANISAVASSAATASTANTSSLTTLTASVGSNTTSIASLTSAIASLGGTVATWQVTFNTNGAISGLTFTSTTGGGTTTSDFRVLADTFELVDASNNSIKPITYAAGVLTFNGTVNINGSTSFAAGYSPTDILAAAATASSSAIAAAIASIGTGSTDPASVAAAVAAVYTNYGGSSSTTTINGGVIQSGTIIAGKMATGFLQTAFASISDTLYSTSYVAGTHTVAPTGFKLSNSPFTIHLLDGTDITGNFEIGGDVSIGGNKAAVINNKLFHYLKMIVVIV